MATFQEVVPCVVEFLIKRHFQLEFRVSHAFFRRPPREDDEVSEYQSSESGSIDSDNQQFQLAEDAIVASLAGYIRRSKQLAPELDSALVRHKNTAYLHGWMYATASISKLASVSKAWWMFASNKLPASTTLRLLDCMKHQFYGA